MRTIFKSIILLIMISCQDTGNNDSPGKNFETYLLKNKNGIEIKITNYGAKVMYIKVPDKTGKMENIVLGYDNPVDYIKGNPYFGAAIGRYANRISNGTFKINGQTYNLKKNNNGNHLHGGYKGFHNVFWKKEKEYLINNVKYIELYYISPDGEENYPGNLKVNITYSLNDKNEFKIEYYAIADEKTHINLTHHSFFNLKDGGKSKILTHLLKINANNYTPVKQNLIPTGEILSVKNTPFDFTAPLPIGSRIENDDTQLQYGKGYDHNYVINKTKKEELAKAAEVYEPETGRVMEVFTTEPGLQFYSGNFLDGSDIGHAGVSYKHRTAFCLEAQHFPDSPNHKNFPSTLLEPGEEYTQTTIYKFSVK